MYQNELQQIIRYNISQLSALNGQNDFEKICLYFSRARINKNILPATGPVQAGGDQGRDFETFHSYLKKSNISDSSFIGLFSENPVAFACSLEKNPTQKNGKIYLDVKTIMASGSKVERVYFFSGEDIPVAKRHKCQREIRERFSVEIEIIDAHALAQHLCDGDLFWIAIQFLRTPMECYPRQISEDWYSSLLAEYKDRRGEPTTFQEFSEIKSAIRHVYKNDLLKSDLIFWLPKLDSFIGKKNNIIEALARKAIYEKFVASLIGLNNVQGLENLVERYFSEFEDYTSISDLEDAQCLLSFCLSSKKVIGNDLSENFLVDIQSRFENLLISRYSKTENTDTKCFLLEIHANFSFHHTSNKFDSHKRVNSFIDKLQEIVPHLKKSHYYPVERLSSRVNDFIEIFLELPVKPDLSKIEELALKIDAVLLKRGGRDITAKKLRERAVIFLRKGEILKSISCLHKVKIEWFNEDSIRGSILSCLLLSKNYSHLNLYYASKYYALIAAHLAINSKKVELSNYFVEGMSMVADCDYSTGSWLNYLDICDFLLGTHYQITKDFDVYNNKDTPKLLYYPAIIYHSSQVLLPEAEIHIANKISQWGYLNADILELSKKVKQNFSSLKQEYLETINEQISGRAFNDFGSLRKIDFNVWGCNWRFKFENNYETNSIAEEFVSIFQIILADLNEKDLCTVSSEVEIQIIYSTNPESKFNNEPSNDRIIWTLELSEFSGKSLHDLHNRVFNYFAIAQTIIYECSLLPFFEYQKIIKEKLKKDILLSKVFFGRPYADLYQTFITPESYSFSQREKFANPLNDSHYIPKENSDLPWKKSISEKYDKQKSLEAINNRIKNSGLPINKTLPLLQQSNNFKKLIKSLRDKGWLDWQILQCITMIIVNHKVNFKINGESIEELQNKFLDYFCKSEDEWYTPIPESILTEERIENELNTILPVTLLPSFGLEFHSRTPNGKAIIELLKHRFNYFEDGKDLAVFDF
jgi:hypothetical protein